MVELGSAYNQLKTLLNRHAECIQRGAMALQIDCHLDSDPNNWDMEQLATVGYNISKTQSFKHCEYEFDSEENRWIYGDERRDFDPLTGLPI